MPYPVDSQGRPVITVSNPQVEGGGTAAKAGSSGVGAGAIGMIAGGALSTGAQLLGDWLNRRWETKMANSAHQREVADLRKAGLNPILSATGGRGAPVPAGNVGDMTGLGSGVASASRLASLEKQLMVSQIGLNSASEQSRRAETARTLALTPEAVRLVQAQTRERAASAHAIQQSADIQRTSPSKLREWLPPDWIQKGHDALENFFGSGTAKDNQ